MKKALTLLAFFLLLEYQVFIGQGSYSIVPIIGLILLCAYEVFFENKNFFFREQKLSEYRKNELSLGEKLGAGIYAAIFILSVIFGSGLGAQFTFVLIAGVLGVTIISVLENKKAGNYVQVPG